MVRNPEERGRILPRHLFRLDPSVRSNRWSSPATRTFPQTQHKLRASVGALLIRQYAVNVAALNGVAPPVPVLARLAVPVKTPLPSQAWAVRETVPLKALFGTKRIKSAADNNKALVAATVGKLVQFVPSVEYCQVPTEVPVWAVMATPTEMPGASSKAFPKMMATVLPAGFGAGLDAEKPSTGVSVALTPATKVGACFTKSTANVAVAAVWLYADVPPSLVIELMAFALPTVWSHAR